MKILFFMMIGISLSANAVDLPVMVNLKKLGIAMGKTEVTQGQWQAIMGYNPGYFKDCGPDCPIEQVYPGEIKQFISKVNTLTGVEYRLPTEEEWLMACKAGGKGSFCGHGALDKLAWYEGNALGTTHPVGLKIPNRWGLYDMTGNVWELTSSCYEGDCEFRVLKGGGWASARIYANASYPYQHASDAAFRSRRFGFRLVRDLKTSEPKL